MRNLVSPRLGAGSQARSHEKVLPAVPNWVYAKLERWHHLSFLRTRAVLNMLHSTKVQAFEPEKIEALIHLIEEDLGYHLHAAVQRVKCRLSEAEAAEFHFVDGDLEIRAAVRRAEFEEWIADDVHTLERCIDGLLQTSGVSPRRRGRGLPDRRIFVCAGRAPDLRRPVRRGPGAVGERVHLGGARAGPASGGSGYMIYRWQKHN